MSEFNSPLCYHSGLGNSETRGVGLFIRLAMYICSTYVMALAYLNISWRRKHFQARWRHHLAMEID